jgi:hypothetical protein
MSRHPWPEVVGRPGSDTNPQDRCCAADRPAKDDEMPAFRAHVFRGRQQAGGQMRDC